MEKYKLFEHTAKKISCVKCGAKMNELNPHTHGSKSMYKTGDKEYLCKSTKCFKGYLNESFQSYENEGDNYTKEEVKEIQSLRALGWNDMLKKKFKLDS